MRNIPSIIFGKLFLVLDQCVCVDVDGWVCVCGYGCVGGGL